MKKEFESSDKYLWGFVNQKPIFTLYKVCKKIPVKNSKSGNIGKDLPIFKKKNCKFVEHQIKLLF